MVADMEAIQIRSPVNATVEIPGSKSLTHRALITAGLARGTSRLKNVLICEDSLYTINGLQELGIRTTLDGDDARVMGTGGKFSRTDRIKEIFLGNSGTSFRLLLSTVALSRGEFILSGTPRMHERPIGGLVTSLSQMGVNAWCPQKKGYPPVRIRSRGIPGGKVSIPGDQSSQFISSLLLAGPYAENPVEIEVIGNLVSRPYVDLTLDVMAHFGVNVFREDYHYYKIPNDKKYRPCPMSVEGDVSSASYFWAAAAVSGGTITTRNIYPHTTRQGDIGLLEIFKKMGCQVQSEATGVTVSGGPLRGTVADMNSMPDMVPTLAAVALFAEGRTVIKNVAQLRHKESDRLKAVTREFSRLGAHIHEHSDGLTIEGEQNLHGCGVDSHDDHRMAMALAVVGLKVPGLVINNSGCVHKSFPRFWDLWQSLK